MPRQVEVAGVVEEPLTPQMMNSESCFGPPLRGRLDGLIHGIVPLQVHPAICRASEVVGSCRQSVKTIVTACSVEARYASVSSSVSQER